MSFLSSSPGTRLGALGSLALATAWTAASFTAVMPTAAEAQDTGRGYYRAELAQPASQARVIGGDVVWACKGTSCVAAKGTSRPVRVCRDLQRKQGQIASFTTSGAVLEATDLGKCNG